MTEAVHPEKHGFQTEVKQLLQLMIHSLYSNKEIFLRELISNAADAADKLRFRALSQDSLYEGDGDLHVKLSIDKEAGTITIADNGIGMSKAEAIEHLGTIAKSGTKEFFGKQIKIQGLSGNPKVKANLLLLTSKKLNVVLKLFCICAKMKKNF